MKFPWLAILLVFSIIWWHGVFSIWFAQDDFFILSIVGKLNFLEIFLPNPQVVYYRPLGIFSYFWLASRIFGLSPIWFHLLGLLVHLSNCYLVYLLLKKILKEKAFYGTILYSLSSIHFLSLGWLSNFSYLLGAFFAFGAFWAWLQRKNYFLILFILGLLTNEFIVILPFILLSYRLIFKIKHFVAVPLVISAIYLFLRLVISHPPGGTDYQFVTDPLQIIKNYQWYLLWSFGWPETMKDQLKNLFVINSQSDFLPRFLLQFIVFLVGFWLMLALLIAKIAKLKDFKIIIFSACWWLLGLIPVIFFKNHAYPHYNFVSIFGLILVATQLFDKRLSLYLFAAIWILVSFVATRLNFSTHWLSWHSDLSRRLVNQALTDYRDQPSSQIILLVDDVGQAQIALSDQEALKVVFLDDRIETVYRQK